MVCPSTCYVQDKINVQNYLVTKGHAYTNREPRLVLLKAPQKLQEKCNISITTIKISVSNCETKSIHIRIIFIHFI